MKAFLTVLLFFFCLFPSFTFAQGNNLVIVVDSSGSMWGRLDGFIKMELAKSSLNDALLNLREETNVGLMAFGHRRRKDCSDIELLEPIAKLDRGILTAKVSSLKAKGKTPLEKTIRVAVEEVQAKGEKATILIISDGKDTCGGDPCAIAKTLKEESSTDFVIDVIGLVSQMNGKGRTLSEESYTQLQCITDATGGTFYSVENARDFKLAIADSIAQETVVELEVVKPPQFVTNEEDLVDLLTDTPKSRTIIDAATVIKAGFVDDEDNVETIGKIIGVETNKENVYLYDKVTVELTRAAKIGDKVLIYDIFTTTNGFGGIYKIKVPFKTDISDSNGDNMGQLYDINGILEITQILGAGRYKAKMIMFFDSVFVGSFLTPFDTEIVNPPKRYPYLKRPTRQFNDAEIIESYKKKRFNGFGDVVYINKGKNQKILIGDNFEIYPDKEIRVQQDSLYPKIGEKVIDFLMSKEDPEIERSGVLTIIGLRKNTAIGYIIQSDRKIISAGHRLEIIQD